MTAQIDVWVWVKRKIALTAFLASFEVDSGFIHQNLPRKITQITEVNHCPNDHEATEVALDQLRTIDKSRLSQSMGLLTSNYPGQILAILADIFAE